MDFSDYAANEISTLVARLLARRSQESLASFLAFREALDEVTRTIEAWSHVDTSDEVADVARRLGAEAMADAQHAAERRNEEALATVNALHDRVQDLEGEVHAHRERADQAAADSARLHHRVDAESQEKQRLASALEEANSRLRAIDEQRRATANQLSATSAQITALKNANVENERGRRELQARLDAALAMESTLRHRIAEGELEIARARTEVQSANFTSGPLSVDRLLAGFEQLAEANTLPDILSALASALASDFSRVALFNVKGKRLEGVSQIGFESTSDISKIVVPLTSSSLLGKAILSNAVEAFPADKLDDAVRGPFGGTPECVLALPIAVRGETIAVLYADDSGQSAGESVNPNIRAKFAELLRRFAVPCLEKHTTKPERVEELAAYAALLLDEVEYMYAADLGGGQKGLDLQNRLDDNLRSARQFYARRVATEAPAAASLFDERLATLMAERSATPFGRDLALVALRSDHLVGRHAERTAEAV